MLARWVLARMRVGVLFQVTLAVLSALVAGLMAWNNLWGATVLEGAMDLTMPCLNAGLGAYFTAVVPDELQGRAGSALGFVSMGRDGWRFRLGTRLRRTPRPPHIRR